MTRPIERKAGLPARAFALLAIVLAHLAVFLLKAGANHKPAMRTNATVPVAVVVNLAVEPRLPKKLAVAPLNNSKPRNQPQPQHNALQPIAATAPASTAVPLQQPQSTAGNDPVAPAAREAARFGGNGPLNLSLPKGTAASQPRSAYEQALNDPRSTSVHLTWDEKFAISMGAIDCIFQERLPDGSIYRAPGHLKHVSATGGVGVGVRPVLVPQCVK